jgi:Arc/MetJ-type ribon-helix-helix transcriptional regulator
MTIEIPDTLADAWQARMRSGGFEKAGELLEHLLRQEPSFEEIHGRTPEELEALLIEGLESGPSIVWDEAYEADFRRRFAEHAEARKISCE